jgi:hypothetical protein
MPGDDERVSISTTNYNSNLTVPIQFAIKDFSQFEILTGAVNAGPLKFN